MISVEDKIEYVADNNTKLWNIYRKSLGTNPTISVWDYVIITASNENQALGFRLQIEKRLQENALPSKTKFGVVPDPIGERVGNGGAMLGAMRYVAECSGRSDFKGLKVLVILSSGDSRRVAQYSALGKIFSPVPRKLPNEKASTLFDEIMITMAPLPSKIGCGMLVLSGDVMLAFDSSEFPCIDETFALSFPEPVETGSHHGVFKGSRDGYIEGVWHKQKPEKLYENKAVDENGYVNIDTGAVFFAPDILSELFGLIIDENGVCTSDSFHRYVNGTVQPSLYVDFFYPLSLSATYEGYKKEVPEGKMCSGLMELREKLWKILSPHKIRLISIASSDFIHFGSTEEVMSLMAGSIEKYNFLGWRRQVLSCGCPSISAAYCSTVDESASVGKDVYIEWCSIGKECSIGDGAILSCLEVEKTDIPSKIVLHALNLTNGAYVVRSYGVNDNPKLGENGATLFGIPLSSLLVAGVFRSEDFWPREDECEHTLWNARLYSECKSMSEAICEALNFYNIVVYGKGDVDRWRKSVRHSLSSSFNSAKGESLVRY